MTERLAPVFDLDELKEIFEYKNRRAVTNAIRNGTFPVKTFELGYRKIVAHVDVVNNFFKEQKEEGLAAQDEQEQQDWDSV
jgi:hypothetical protein